LARLERVAASLRNPEAAGALAEGRGAILLAAGDHERAAGEFRAAIARWTALERPYDRARALVGLADALLAAGDPAARKARDEASAIVAALADQLGDAALKRSFLDSPLALSAGAPLTAGLLA
jgi:hypothetical protein